MEHNPESGVVSGVLAVAEREGQGKGNSYARGAGGTVLQDGLPAHVQGEEHLHASQCAALRAWQPDMAIQACDAQIILCSRGTDGKDCLTDMTSLCCDSQGLDQARVPRVRPTAGCR